MNSMFPYHALLNMEVIWLYYLILINHYKFMNVWRLWYEDIYKIPYIGVYDKLKNIFPIIGNSFQRKPKIIAAPYILQ